MKYQTSAALVLFATTARACLQFGARITGDRQLVGATVDNGQTTCQINTNLNFPGPDQHYWCSGCQFDFDCWVSLDLGTLAYRNGAANHRIAIQRNGDYISASAFC